MYIDYAHDYYVGATDDEGQSTLYVEIHEGDQKLPNTEIPVSQVIIIIIISRVAIDG